MFATLMLWPAVTATPDNVKLPAPGIVVIVTAVSALAGLSLGSVKPKSAAANVYCVSSSVVTVLSVPAGASLTEVTSTVIVLADCIQIDAAVGGAAVVLHLEREARVAGAVRIGCRQRTSSCPS